MNRLEYINISGLRQDGRRPRELRRLRSEMGLFRSADGSALFEMGQTQVLAVVYGPCAVARGRGEHDEVTINCDFS
jgi:exosome complex component RRP41